MPLKNMLIGAVLLGAFAVVGTGLVALTFDATAERIARAEREALLSAIHALVPPDSHDNDLFLDTITISDPRLGTTAPVPVYRARRGGTPVAAVIASIAPEGYSGAIRLLVAVHADGSLAGVRVVSHRETPGLGDRIEVERSDWIRSFDGKSLAQPEAEQWKVKKDGGVFDQFTGATITPRAVVKGVYNTLRYFAEHREALFAPAAAAQPEQEAAHG